VAPTRWSQSSRAGFDELDVRRLVLNPGSQHARGRAGKAALSSPPQKRIELDLLTIDKKPSSTLLC
jgi:hypothetical protein